MTTPYKQNGISRSGYETDRVRLDHFPALECDWAQLLNRLAKASGNMRYRDGEREGMLACLWVDHVLVVLTEIVLTDVSGKRFVEMSGTAAQTELNEKQGEKANEWIDRLDRYIGRNRKMGQAGSPATLVAVRITEQLKQALPADGEEVKQAYYRLLRTIGDIRNLFGTYLSQIESCADIDGALSLLIVYLRNYAGIAETFNRRFATLPEIYLRDILHAVPHPATADNTYIIVVPAEGTPSFTLPAGQPFPAGQNDAGEELIYRTRRAEYITPMQCAEVLAVHIEREGGKATAIRKQAVPFSDVAAPKTLFDKKHSRALPLGWMIESSMLILNEGERTVCLSFRVTSDTALLPANDLLADYFTLRVSTAEGWTAQPCACRIDTPGRHPRLSFSFTISADEAAPAPCNAETHGTSTEHPALRILTSDEYCSYDWASRLTFDAVKIRTDVTGIRNFTFYNELGQVDTSQPFQPFGIRAEKDAWFLFGNEEMGLKPLEEVRLKGLWKKLPETEAEFNKLYKYYTAAAGQTVDLRSFTIATEWQEDRQWHDCEADGVQHLFVPDTTGGNETRSLSRAEVVFLFEETSSMRSGSPTPYEYSRDRDGFFRATLRSPSIGFGMDAYRTLFTETMIYNSHCKEKKRRALPPEPVNPLLADAELSYIASEETTLREMSGSSIRLTRLTPLSEQETFPINNKEEHHFLPVFATDKLLYFGFLHAEGEQTVRIYLDLVLPKEKTPFYNPQPGKNVCLTWAYRDGEGWHSLPIDSVHAEETSGLTQSGFVEIRLPKKIKEGDADQQGRIWLCATVKGDVSSCLAIRNVRTNCIPLTALNGDGSPLPAGTIQDCLEPDERIASIVQPLPGFGGMPAETETGAAIRQVARISNRHRALLIKDYERLVMEHFPEVDKVQCLSVPKEKGASEVCLVVFSRAEDRRYFLSPAWKLAEIERMIRRYAPPFAPLRVINPVYEPVIVRCKAVLWDRVQDEGKAIRQLVVLAQNYLAPWYRKGGIPALRQHFSYKELHARMVNHEDLMRLVVLEVNGKSLPHVDIDSEDMLIRGTHPWSVLIPRVEIVLLSPHDGINYAEIGNNFIIR